MKTLGDQRDWKTIEDTYEARTYTRLPVVFTHGKDYWLYDESGKAYVDLYGGHCVALLGHSPPAVIEAIQKQAKTLFFYSNMIYHPTRALAAEKLIQSAPQGFDKVFFCNSGTEANETAMKLAWKTTGKTHFISTQGAFHGRTLASLAVTHSEKLRKPYASLKMPGVSFIPFGEAAAAEEVFSRRSDVAGLIIEPIQSMAGVRTAPAAYFQALRALCDRFGALLIFDEVQTGLGRTGKFSMSEWFDMRPDLITLAKGLGAGFPIGAVLMPNRIAETLVPGDLGSTFAGGMLACAACAATLEEIQSKNLMANALHLFETVREGLADTPIVTVRGAGGLIGIQFSDGLYPPKVNFQLNQPPLPLWSKICRGGERAGGEGIPENSLLRPLSVKPLIQRLFEEGWIVGSCDNPAVIRLLPPLITPPSVLQEFCTLLKRLLNDPARNNSAVSP